MVIIVLRSDIELYLSFLVISVYVWSRIKQDMDKFSTGQEPGKVNVHVRVSTEYDTVIAVLKEGCREEVHKLVMIQNALV